MREANRSMRVAMISPLPPEKPGEALYTTRLIEALAKNRDIEIVAIGGPASRPLNIPGANVETAPIWKSRSLLYPLTLWRFIRKRRVHLVHVQFGPHGAVYGGMFGEVMLFLLLLLRYTGTKTTVTSHSTWTIEQVKVRIKEKLKLSVFPFLAPAIFGIFMKLLDWGTDTIQLSTVRLNSTLKQTFLNEFGYDPNKVVEIPHPCAGVERIQSREEAMKRLGVTNKKIVLVFGFIRRDKGIHLAMEAIKTLRKNDPNILLLVAGKPFDMDGRVYLQELLKLQKDNGLFENVRFDTAYISKEMIPVYFSAASIILAPYTESVGASGPLHEACGYGTPIVASEAGVHIREALGGNVVIFDQEDVDDLREKLEYVLTNKSFDQEIRAKLLKYAEKETWDKAAERTIAYYRKTLGIGENPRE